jgi:transcriptional regulator with XRE-family HTH domain
MTNEDYVDRRIGGRIRHWREQAGMSQQELAEKLRVSQQVISSMESGSRLFKANEFGRIARALGATTDELFAEPGYTGEAISLTGGAAVSAGRGKAARPTSVSAAPESQ